MSEKEQLLQLIDNMPDYKIGYILAYAQELTATDIETVEPDKFDKKILESIKNDPDCSEFVSSEDAMKELGLNQVSDHFPHFSEMVIP